MEIMKSVAAVLLSVFILVWSAEALKKSDLRQPPVTVGLEKLNFKGERGAEEADPSKAPIKAGISGSAESAESPAPSNSRTMSNSHSESRVADVDRRAISAGEGDVEHQLQAAREQSAQDATAEIYVGAGLQVGQKVVTQARVAAETTSGVAGPALTEAKSFPTSPVTGETLNDRAAPSPAVREDIAQNTDSRAKAAQIPQLRVDPPKSSDAQSGSKNTDIANAEILIEDNQHAAREAVAHARTIRIFAALEHTLQVAAQQRGPDRPKGAEQHFPADVRPDRHVAPDIARARREEADRIVEDLQNSILAARDRAVVERARVAAVEIAKDARSALTADEAMKDVALEDRQHAARERLAQQSTDETSKSRAEEAARIVEDLQKQMQAVDDRALVAKARTAQIDADKVASAELAKKQAEAETIVENNQFAARQRESRERTAELVVASDEEATRIVADLETSLQLAAERSAVELAREAERQAKVALGVKQEAEEALLDDRRHAARQRIDQQATAELVRARSKEATRIVADLQNALDAAADRDRAVVERIRLAQIDYDKKKRMLLAAKQMTAERALDDRQHAARQRLARQATIAFENTRKQESTGAVADLGTSLQATAKWAVATADSFAQIKVDRPAPVAGGFTQNDSGRSAHQQIARVERARRDEAARIVADLDNALKAGVSGAGRSAFSQISDRTETTMTVPQSSAPAKERRSIDVAKTEARIENILHRSKQRAAKQVSMAMLESPREISIDGPAQTPLQLHSASLRDHAATAEKKTSKGRAISVPPHAAFATADALSAKLQRQCPSILGDQAEFDDDLVALCRDWALRR